jgi:anthranilate synthase component 2
MAFTGRAISRRLRRAAEARDRRRDGDLTQIERRRLDAPLKPAGLAGEVLQTARAGPQRLDGRGGATQESNRSAFPRRERLLMPAVTLIDNYDSFTFNLVHYLGALGAEVTVWRNDAISVADVLAARPDAIVLSPGPCTPNEAGICLDLVRSASETTPIFGVCLGHQAIGQVFGGSIIRAPVPMHGKLSRISHNGRGVFRGVNGSFQATRYHSLVIDRKSAPPELEITAETEDGLIMGVSHRTAPVHGVQFHPESILSEHGRVVLRNFLDLTGAFNAAARVN